MSAEKDHIALANINHEALEHLLPEYQRFPEWLATIAFYKAVQVAEAVFATSGSWHSANHGERDSTLKMERFKELQRDYAPLYRASRIARYLEDSSNNRTVSTFRSVYASQTVRDSLIYKRLFTFEQNSRKWLTADGWTALKKIKKP